MAEWKPTIHFEGVDEGAAQRDERELPFVLRRDALNAAGLRPSGDPAAFAVAPVRRGRGGEPAGRRGVAVVETPFEGQGTGELLLVRFEDGVRVIYPDRTRGGGDRTTFPLPVSPGPQGDRSLLGTAARWLVQKVVFPLVDPVLGRVSDALVGRWEVGRRPHRVRFYAPGDYREVAARAAEPGDLRSGPVLLLVHGTNSLSHSASGLGALPSPLVQHFCDEYRQQVLAFDHPTLATDPLDNARWLANWLRDVPADVEIDVLAHSRGGLVARLLLERPDLVQLGRARVRFRSLTCVATPHQGTPLADPEHLGGFVDRLLTLAAPLPDNPVTLAIEGALTVARQLAAGFVGGLDGVTCMRPAAGGGDGSGRWLDQLEGGRRRPSGVRYRSVVADYEPSPGSGWWHSIKDAGVDVVFGGSPNDVVVPTLSALTLPRAERGFDEMVVFDEHDNLHHSRYFAADLLQPALRSWLREEPDPLPAAVRSRLRNAEDVRSLAELGPEWSLAKALDLTCVAPTGIQPKLQNLVRAAGGRLWNYVTGRGDTRHPPVVVLVPGIMGSELSVGDDRLWLSPWRLAQGAFDQLRLGGEPADPVATAGEVLCLGYRSALDRLARRYHMVAFPYDWRQDVRVAADRLRTLLETLLDDEDLAAAGVPLHVVAHSMGGLVTRQALDGDGPQADAPGPAAEPLLQRLAARGGRVVLLGTPNQGSLATPLALIGRHPVISVLSRVDVRRSLAEWLDVLWTFPGIVQLLPRPDLSGDVDGGNPVRWLYETTRWRGRPADRTEVLMAAATRLHEQLGRTDGHGLHLILGDGVTTPVAIRPVGSDGFEVAMADAGDGTVARRCGALEGARTFYALGVNHGDLVRDARTLQAVTDILERGQTSLLRGEPRGDGASAGAPPTWMGVEEAGQRLAGAVAATRGTAAAPPPLQAWTRREALDTSFDALGPFLGTSRSHLPPLRVSIVHGGLEHARHALLVGHGTGTPIAGAEGRCDELLGKQLSTLQLLGLYPDTPGGWRYVACRGDRDRLPGCIVLGLDSGEPLSRGVLSDLVTQAVLDYAERVVAARAAADPSPAGAFDAPATPASVIAATVAITDGSGEDPAVTGVPVGLGISAVAVGSGAGFGLGIERSVTAILQGVQRANEVLHRVKRPLVEELELVDRYAGQVERIQGALQRVNEQAPVAADGEQAVVLVESVAEKEGRRDGMPPPDYDSGRWEHLSVDTRSADGRAEGRAGDGQAAVPDDDDNERHLTYRFARNRAAASETPRRVDRAVVFGILQEAVDNPAQSVELGRVLYEELLPVELKDELSRIDNLVLQVDDRTADLPWELFGDRLVGDQPLACRVGLLRQLRDPSLRVRTAGSLPDTALVIGDPPSDLMPLPSARAEARDVANLLRGGGMDVVQLDPPDDTVASTATANRIRKAFWSRDHRVVHIAAHGLYRLNRPGGRVQGGIVIGPRAFLTADDFRNLRGTPDLVFLNCCHLGRVGAGERSAVGLLDPVGQHQAAASLAAALMGIGVKAVVVAGWQVDDQVASQFASVFYRLLLGGELYGEAVKAARVACYERGDGRDNTWAAYQCYGDPAFRLRRAAVEEGQRVGRITVRSIGLRHVEDLLVRSREVADHEILCGELTHLDRELTQRWPQDGELLYRLGQTWAELGDYGRGIERYEQAVNATDGAAPLRAIEQLVNLNLRRALELRRAGEDVGDLVAQADRWAERLGGLGDSGERNAIDAASWKRKAILQPEDRLHHLERSITHYVNAARRGHTPLYGFRNAIHLAAVSGEAPPRVLVEFLHSRQCLGEWAAELTTPARGGDFWARVGGADSRLTAVIVEADSALGRELLALLDQCAEEEPRQGRGELKALIEADIGSQVESLTAGYGAVRVGGFRKLGWRSAIEHISDLARLAEAAALASAAPLSDLYRRLERLGE
jgi:hypothetical protein